METIGETCYLCHQLFPTVDELFNHQSKEIHSIHSIAVDYGVPFVRFELGRTETEFRPTPRPRGGPFVDLELFDVSDDDESDDEDGLVEDSTDIISTWLMDTTVPEVEIKELEGKKMNVKFVRLYARGTILGYRRSRKNQSPKTPLIQIHGVTSKEDVAWYVGKKIAYIYKAKTKKVGSKCRCIWGRVTRHHGNSGVARTSFRWNLPPKSFGSIVRVFLYPSNI